MQFQCLVKSPRWSKLSKALHYGVVVILARKMPEIVDTMEQVACTAWHNWCALTQVASNYAPLVVPSSCRERFSKCSGNAMLKHILECRCHASALQLSVVSRIVALVICESRHHFILPGICNYRTTSPMYFDTIRVDTNAAGFVVCCGSSHLVLHGPMRRCRKFVTQACTMPEHFWKGIPGCQR